MKNKKKYDLAVSFAGEDRNFVESFCNELKKENINLFYDKFEEHVLWGKNLLDYFNYIYSTSTYVIMFISKNYIKKWTEHEKNISLNRIFNEGYSNILYVRFDDTQIDGILNTICYIDLQEKTPKQLADIFLKKFLSDNNTIPSEQKRKENTYIEKQQINPYITRVTVLSDRNEPVKNADVIIIADNNTYKNKKTDDNGIAEFSIQTKRKYKILIAHYEYSGFILNSWDITKDLQIKINQDTNIGSIICISTCYIPNLKGRCNLIHDTNNRTYLYADNIAINGGVNQPEFFSLNTPFTLEDCDGNIISMTVLFIQGNVSLIEYQKR